MSDDPILASLARLEAGQQVLVAGQQALTAAHQALAAGHQDLTAAHQALAARVGLLHDGQTTLRVDLMARIDRLENHITDIRDDISVNMGRADRAHDAVVNTREDVRNLAQEMTTMWRQIKRLESKVRELRGEGA